jgi:hypothetical protein
MKKWNKVFMALNIFLVSLVLIYELAWFTRDPKSEFPAFTFELILVLYTAM